MTDKQRRALLERAVAELKLTEQGYHATGTHWKPAMRDLEALAKDLAPPVLRLVSPIPKGVKCTVGGLHRTAGDTSFAENWALDWIVPAGTPILACEDAVVTKLSGHDPNDDTWDSKGVYGWSIHFEAAGGWHYYLTHLGARKVTKVGQRVKCGEILGWVGDQDFRPDHLHQGVTAPSGAKGPACGRIEAVRDAPRIAA